MSLYIIVTYSVGQSNWKSPTGISEKKLVEFRLEHSIMFALRMVLT